MTSWLLMTFWQLSLHLLSNFLGPLLNSRFDSGSFLLFLENFLGGHFLSLLEPEFLPWRNFETSRSRFPCLSAGHKNPILDHLLHGLLDQHGVRDGVGCPRIVL